ncbi:MAG: nitroreductase family protein [Spirochaetes bacterium]|nr:nitroreductase family protein [Spirochaetota bacterium]
MDLTRLIQGRRAYRSLKPVSIDEKTVSALAESARLSPSCFNNQPWRYVFVYDKKKLEMMFEALAKGNRWAYNASLIVAVVSNPEFDCRIKSRDYYLFDTGMATAFMILRATDLGFVAHPIAGFDEQKVKEILGVPEDRTVITLVIVGRHSETIGPDLSEKQIEWEKKRPERLPLEKFAYRNGYDSDDAPPE